MKKPSILTGAFLLGSLLYTSLVVSDAFIDMMVAGKHFFFFFSLSLLSVWYFIQVIVRKGTVMISLNRADMWLAVFFVYGLLRVLTTSHINPAAHAFIIFAGLFLVYLIARYCTITSNSQGYFGSLFWKALFILILAVALIQTGMGFLQLTGVFESYNANTPFCGFFNNPGPYAIFLSGVFPFFVGMILYRHSVRLFRWLAGITMAGILVIVVLSDSRTAWIALMAGIIYLLSVRYGLHNKVWKWLDSPIKKVAIIGLALVVTIAAGYGLYQYKKDSALGRFFIWKNTVHAIVGKPVLGHGLEKYQYVHSNYQAEYFRDHPADSKQAYLASQNPYAFNDYLEMALEFGLVGLILFIGFGFHLLSGKISSSQNKDPVLTMAKASVAVILVAALFSYPLQKLPISILLFFSAGLVSGLQVKSLYQIHTPNWAIKPVSGIALILVVLFAVYQYSQLQAYKDWKKTYVMLHTGQPKKAFSQYAILYPVLKYDPFFLFNYGAELSMIGEYQKSSKILEKAKWFLNDADVYVYLGNNYESLDEFDRAIEAFEQAAFGYPLKFYPKYRLVPLYFALGEKEKALSLARNIIELEPKVPSETVDRIKQETREFLEVYGEK